MAARQKKQVDERVKNLQNKIYKEVCVLIMIVCSISILIKFFQLGVSLDNVLTEWLIIFISSAYYYVRTAYLGILTDEIEVHDSNSKVKFGTKNVLFGVVFGLVFALVFGLNSAFNYADSTQQAIEYFVVVFLVSLIIYVPLLAGVMSLTYKAAKKKSDQVVQKNLED